MARILLVEDNELNYDMLSRRLLANLRHELRTPLNACSHHRQE